MYTCRGLGLHSFSNSTGTLALLVGEGKLTADVLGMFLILKGYTYIIFKKLEVLKIGLLKTLLCSKHYSAQNTKTRENICRLSADSQQILSRFSADSQQILSRFSADTPISISN